MIKYSRTLLIQTFVFSVLFTTLAWPSNLRPWKVIALNKFPDLAVKISTDTNTALALIEAKMGADEKKKKLTEKIVQVEAAVAQAKTELGNYHFPPETLDEVSLDLKDVKLHVDRKDFPKAAAILRDYQNAFEKYIWVR